jgi:DNA-binding PadR family transcriptional regulator
MAVKEGLLALLASGPAHGYQLKTAFEAATGGVWQLNVGQVYTTLDRLARDGLVATVVETDQKTYELTADGREALGAWWNAVVAEDPPPRDELVLKVLLAIERAPDHAIEVITHQRAALVSVLQQRRRAARQADASSVASELADESVMVRAEADLRWLDVCEARVLTIMKEPR